MEYAQEPTERGSAPRPQRQHSTRLRHRPDRRKASATDSTDHLDPPKSAATSPCRAHPSPFQAGAVWGSAPHRQAPGEQLQQPPRPAGPDGVGSPSGRAAAPPSASPRSVEYAQGPTERGHAARPQRQYLHQIRHRACTLRRGRMPSAVWQGVCNLLRDPAPRSPQTVACIAPGRPRRLLGALQSVQNTQDGLQDGPGKPPGPPRWSKRPP